MKISYIDNPHNISDIATCVVMEEDKIVSEIISASKCYFYDTCSFRRHANLEHVYAEYIFNYIKSTDGVIIITRCILMELASHSGILNQEYIEFLQRIKEFGITVLLVYEEDIFFVMEECFGTNAVINEYLCWAVRNILSPVSTIFEALQDNETMYNEIIKGKNIDNSKVYKRFFENVRKRKDSGDNLGEELLAICLHILSHLPGEENGKFSVITDDKGAASKIDSMFKKTRKQFGGKDVGIFSTPKLVQILYREKILSDENHIKDILKNGTEGNIVVLGMFFYDIRAKEIKLNKEQLAALIMQPNGISIFF